MMWIPLLTLCLLQAPAAKPTAGNQDVVVLKSGRRLTGELLEKGKEQLRLRTKSGEVRIRRLDVRVLTRKGQARSLLSLHPPELAEGAKPPSTYIALRKNGPNGTQTLSTAVSRWYHAETDTTLFLVGAVHIGEKQYFSRLQEILDSTDVVLFEGVGAGKDGKKPSEEDLARIDLLFKLQLTLGGFLGLRFQKDCIDYNRPFWKNADVDFTTLMAKIKREKLSFPTDNPILKFILKPLFAWIDPREIKQNPKIAKRMRRQAAPLLARSSGLLARKGMRKMQSVLIEFRNDTAMKAVTAELAHGKKGRWLSLFYGAAHLPDFNKRLSGDKGWQYQGMAWVPAWTFE